MMAAREAYALANPALQDETLESEIGDIQIPTSAWKSHDVIWLFDSLVGPDFDIRSHNYALVNRKTAKRLVEAGLAREESKAERAMAKANGHKR